MDVTTANITLQEAFLCAIVAATSTQFKKKKRQHWRRVDLQAKFLHNCIEACSSY